MPKNLYEDKSRTPKPSEKWKVELRYEKAQEIAPEPIVYERVREEGTLNKHAQNLLRKSRELE